MASLAGSLTSIENNGSYTADAGSNRAVVIMPHIGATGAAATINSVTFGGVSAVEAEQYCELGSEWGMEGCYYILEANIPSGSQTVAVTVSAGTIDEVSICTLQAVNQASPVRETGSAEAISTTSVACNFSSAVAGDFGFIVGHGARTEFFASYTGGWTEALRHNIGTTRTHIVATKAPLSGGTTADDCTTGAGGGLTGRKSTIWVAFADAGGSDTPIVVDSGSLVMEGQNVGLLFEEAYVIPVTHTQMVIEGQDIAFQLAQPYDEGQMVIEGQDVSLFNEQEYSLTVDSGSLALQGQTVAMPLSFSVTAAQMAMEQTIIHLLWSEAVLTTSRHHPVGTGRMMIF